jgi:hypothetical protein
MTERMSQEAVEALARSEWESARGAVGAKGTPRWTSLPDGAPNKERAREKVRRHLPAALAALEADLRERLLSDEAIDAAEATSSRRAFRGEDETRRYKERIRKVIEAALDAAFPTQQEDIPVNPNGVEEGSHTQRIIEHLRTEGEAHPRRVDGVAAALRVYSESDNAHVAELAHAALESIGAEEERSNA